MDDKKKKKVVLKYKGSQLGSHVGGRINDAVSKKSNVKKPEKSEGRLNDMGINRSRRRKYKAKKAEETKKRISGALKQDGMYEGTQRRRTRGGAA